MTTEPKCLPECRTEMDMRRREGERYIIVHSKDCPRYGCSEPKFNPEDEANAPGCHNAEAAKVEDWDDLCGCEPGTYCDNHKPAPAPEPRGSEEPMMGMRAAEWGIERLQKVNAALRAELDRLNYKADQTLKAWQESQAELAQARDERDKFEAESEQKGADLMAAEGVIAEIIDAHERSASSEIGQLIEDARAARAKEGEER